MKNLGSSWTGPTIPRTATARLLLVADISSNNNLGIKIPNRKCSSKERINIENRKLWSKVVQQPLISVRLHKTSLYTITHSKSRRHLTKTNPRSHSQLRFRQQQLIYPPQYKYSRHFRNC